MCLFASEPPLPDETVCCAPARVAARVMQRCYRGMAGFMPADDSGNLISFLLKHLFDMGFNAI
jgi:hypothetical protein